MSRHPKEKPHPEEDRSQPSPSDNEPGGSPRIPEGIVATPTEVTLIELTALCHQMHKRVMNLEKAYGYGVYAPAGTYKWSLGLERRLVESLEEHDWDWPSHSHDTPEFRMGQAHYEKIIYLAGLIPIGRLLILWTRHAKLKIPEVFVDDEVKSRV